MSRRTLQILLASTLALAVAAALPACSGSGKKKKRIVLATEYDDARYGEEASKAVAAEMGLLGDEALDAYVSEIGHKLLRGVPRRGFHYEFKVVDQFEPNAFALPGGYIFVSRGLLALANNEDELACVIGHEIGHAARRHSAAQQALAKRGNPLAMPWVRAATMAGYSRDMEREADKDGQMLAAAAGYDPMGMSTFLRRLGEMERLMVGFKRVPTFFDTHPGSSERAAVNATRARDIRWVRDPSLGDTRRAHLEKIDGLALGQRPESGLFRESRFLHPDLDFHLHFPEGWRTANTNQAVGAVAPDGDALVFLTADLPLGDAEEITKKFVEEAQADGRSVKVEKMQRVKIGGFDAWRVEMRESLGAVSVTNVTTFVPYRDATWRITGMALASRSQRYMGRILNTARSFGRLTDEERASIRSARLRLVTAQAEESLVELGERSHSAWRPNRAAVYNGVFVDHRFAGGEWVKVAKVEPYTPRPAKAQ
ncbi:MAG: M48 family metalloprotease [Myxococcota bacterium]